MIRTTPKHRRDRRMLTLNQPGSPGMAVPTITRINADLLRVTFDRVMSFPFPELAGDAGTGWTFASATTGPITPVGVVLHGQFFDFAFTTLPDNNQVVTVTVPQYAPPRTTFGGFTQPGTYQVAPLTPDAGNWFVSIPPLNRTAPFLGLALDATLLPTTLYALVNTGQINGDSFLTFKAQDSPTGSVWTDIAGATTVAIGTANTVASFAFDRSQPHVRLVVTPTGDDADANGNGLIGFFPQPA